MQEVKKDTLALAKHFVSLPHPAKTTVMVFALCVFFGILFWFARGGGFDPLGLLAGGIDGIFLLAIPSLASCAALFLMRRKAVFRRAVFLGLLTVACYGLFYLLAFSLARIWPPAYNLVFVGFGFACALWYYVLYLAFNFRKSAGAFALLQLALFAMFFLTREGFGASTQPADLLTKVVLSSATSLAALYVLFYFISAPMKKNLKISSTDALSMFLSQWLYGEKDLEEVFDEIGEEAETLVWVGRFEGKGNKCLFVVPYVHFGPFGNLGGSQFTWQIADELSEKGHDVFVFHGTVTHDFNPVSSSDLSRVVEACRGAMAKIRMAPAKLAVSYSKVGSVRAHCYSINDSAFLSFSRAPKTTEDVNFGLGLALMEKMGRRFSSVAVVDEHNSETGDISSVEVGSSIGFEMMDAAQGMLDGKMAQGAFRFACASSFANVESVGKNGMKLALFEQGKDLEALLLIDSNGITPPFRQELLSLFVELGRESGYSCKGEVMTTDTHQVNNVKGVLNPLGTGGKGAAMQIARKLFYEAKEKLEPVKFGSSSQRFSIKVFGTGQSAEIASTINAVVSILRLALPFLLVACALLLIWALGKI
jgi:putative membrane protein